ncbi:spore coat protein [Clostridium sp. DJ247]|uniref:spore coat protein n=1 Tax=Clostridium sp. DJ247 TaxID=2726188 RepID=UPI00162504CB|nr:spore coat protein [Clostridium sp. DJ247]MBC2582358.1 spore coat protein [Clostridium sp. DJ247]
MENIGTSILNQDSITRIISECVAEINGRFFLLIKIEIGNIEQVVVIRISRALAILLIRSGIRECNPQINIPPQGDLICTFVVGNEAFLVFNVETTTTDRLVIVRSPLCQII